MAARTGASSRKPVKGEYIETDSGNKISRRACINGTPNITLGGKTVIQADAVLRGDMHRFPSSSTKGQVPTAISIGKYTVISTGCVIKPPSRVSKGVFTFYSMKIGDNVFIGPHSTITAISISSHVHIGAHSVLQPFCMIKENVKILPYSVVPPNMVVPPGSVVGGNPAQILGEVGEGWGVDAGGATLGAGEWVEGGELRELVRSIK